MFVSYKSQQRVSKIVQFLKGTSSRCKIFQQAILGKIFVGERAVSSGTIAFLTII
ncbi:hypothetical protein [Candidatus Mesenet endosymbiont of Phosphuga atrata]|uniref:hypothetical protein n=1 Tax=Candidatus Mesenet endosymbiont of Phosphuga atrata TaxID=3066221 RepID=UPI0030CB825C